MKSLAIEREYGSGGRAIGKMIAKKYHMPFYDGELLVEAAKDYGISLDILKQYDEMKGGSILYNIVLATKLTSQENLELLNQLYYGIEQTILKINAEGPAVFIGRCSTEILKDNEDVYRIFVTSSDMEERIHRIKETEQVSETQAKQKVKQKDRQREQYFKYWTEKKWKDRDNYDATYDTAVLGIEQCAELIMKKLSQ